MNNERLDEEAIFHIARKLDDAGDRATYLDQICAGDQSLRNRVEALLEAHENESKFLKTSPDASPTAEHNPITEGPGQQIGRFKLLQQIGEGGFGVVYMAEQVRPVRRKVALKIIKPGMDTHAVVARFEAERQALAMMDHPNIARVLDGGATDSGRPFFVMELVKGVPITEYCDKNNLPTNERLELFTVVCQAVQHAHQKGIIHRDLKPSNILVTLADGKPVVKVIDFGVSKALNQQLTEKTLFTAYGQMIGTPQYMSPEQAEMSCLDVDTRSDIYSLGVVLYELLTGTTPLEGERLRSAGFAELQRIIQEEEPPKPSVRLSTSGEKLTIVAKHRSATPERLHKILRGELDWIVMKALEKERVRRYATAKSFAGDIKKYLNDEIVSARPPARVYLLRKLIRRHKAAAMSLAAVFAGLAFALSIVGMKNLQIAKALEREKSALATTQRRVQRQSLAMAFEAFNSGNVPQAKSHLQRVNPVDGSPDSIPYRFLQARINELTPLEIVFPGRIVGFEEDPQGEFYLVVLESGRIEAINAASSVRTKKPVHVFDDGRKCTRSRISNDGRLLLLASELAANDQVVEAFKIVRNGSEISLIQTDVRVSHDGEITGIGFDGSVDRAVSVDNKFTMQVWNTSSGVIQETAIVPGNFKPRGVTCATEGKLVTYSFDGYARFFSSDAARLPDMDINLGDRVLDVVYNPNQRRLAIAGYTGLQIWDVAAGVPRRIRKLDWRRRDNAAFSMDGKIVASSGRDSTSIVLYEVDSGRQLTRIPYGHQDNSGRRALIVSHHRILHAVGDRVLIYRTPREREDWHETASDWNADFAICRDRPLAVFSSGTNECLTVWNLETGESRFVSDDAIRAKRGFAITPSGTEVAAAIRNSETYQDSTICVWSTTTGELSRKTIQDNGSVQSIQFCPTNPNLMVWSGDKTNAYLHDFSTETQQVLTEKASRGHILACEFSSSGRYLVVGANILTGSVAPVTEASLFRIEGDKAKRVEQIAVRHTYRAAVSNNGKWVAFVSQEGTKIKIWDIEFGRFLDDILVSCPRATSIAFSPGDECLVAASPSGEINFLDFRTGEELATFRVDHPLRQVRFMNKFDRVIVSSMDDLIMQWNY